MNAVRWNIAVPLEMDHSVRMLMIARGDVRKGNLSRFVQEAVRIYLQEHATDWQTRMVVPGMDEAERPQRLDDDVVR